MQDIKCSDRSIAGFIPVANPNKACTHLRVSVFYSKGGMNYFNYNKEPSGFFLSVSPVALEDNAWGKAWTTVLTKGFKSLIEGAGRFSQKKLEAHFQAVQRDIENSTGLVTEISSKVAASEGVAA